MTSARIRRLARALGIAVVVAVWAWLNLQDVFFRDALAYWRPDLDDLYGGRHVGVESTYLYSPAFAQLVWPLGFFPWPVFAALWSGLNLSALVWMAGPVAAGALLVIPGSPVIDEISTGNLHLLLAAMVIVGFRHPSVWSFSYLTKITPGIGALWFVGRRQWRALLVVAITTATISLASFVLSPHAWVQWYHTLLRSSEVAVPGSIAIVPGPLWLRVAAAAAITMVAASRGWRWLVPVALVISLPVPWSSGLSILVAMIPLIRTARRHDRRVGLPGQVVGQPEVSSST